MSTTVANARQSMEVRSSEHVRPSMAKASLHSPTSDPIATALGLGPAIWEVLVAGHGSVKAAAFTMGNTDPSLLRRQVIDGTLPLKKLLEADPRALAAFGEFLVEQFGGATKSKRQIAMEKIPELLAAFLDAVSEAK